MASGSMLTPPAYYAGALAGALAGAAETWEKFQDPDVWRSIETPFGHHRQRRPERARPCAATAMAVALTRLVPRLTFEGPDRGCQRAGGGRPGVRVRLPAQLQGA